MSTEPPSDPERFFAGHPVAHDVHRLVCSMLEPLGPFEVRTTRTQVALQRRRGFAYLWFPIEWARRPDVEVVLSVALAREDDSPRWKQVAHPSPRIWMHHLEVSGLDELDEEARDWLAEAYEAAHQSGAPTRLLGRDERRVRPEKGPGRPCLERAALEYRRSMPRRTIMRVVPQSIAVARCESDSP